MKQNLQGSAESIFLKSQNEKEEKRAFKADYNSSDGPNPASTGKLSQGREEIKLSKRYNLQNKGDLNFLYRKKPEEESPTLTIKKELPEIPDTASQSSCSPSSSQHMYLLVPIKTLQTVIDSVGDDELGKLLWKDIFQPLSMNELIEYRRREAAKAAMKIWRIQM